MRLIQEIIIVAMETLGLLLVAAGLGVLAARWVGWAGLAVTGLALLISAGLAARQQRAATRRPPSPTVSPTTISREPPNGKAAEDPSRWARIFHPGPRIAKP